jgi:MFS family permease
MNQSSSHSRFSISPTKLIRLLTHHLISLSHIFTHSVLIKSSLSEQCKVIMRSSSEVFELPNGGWGWIVVFGAQLINVFNQSIISIFGLMFAPFFASINESKTRISLVMNFCSAFLNLSGLLTAPLLKKFSPRAIATYGSLLVSVGLMLSSFATSYFHILLTYSFMVGIGLGLLGPAIFMAVTSYFTTKKSRAIGFALVLISSRK